jgi:DNA-binding NtrC family response regulator
MPTETVLQIEHSPGMLSERRAILEPLGYNVISVLGFSDALDGTLLRQPIGVVVIGHGASWVDRQDLIAHFREALPGTPIVALLRRSDLGFDGADYNCPGDNPSLWIRTVAQALAKGRERRFSSPPE